ncbi:nitrate reductase molybdenum cofactor assembly chaperone [Nocardioides sp.]|uniref:nitrate reductase molybdenum cofactor assembly chaperone n=1 Tax=Nocardioides sp. TaxID=35761 RepID=UPI002D7F040F|nr:nitrate reductase molybdenum cofactor assembly chaperone [Nocardioides sp.]HET8961550.1 nitrate reductase molybdenum cofactor assembly chaperone [Nocardioides sp.]
MRTKHPPPDWASDQLAATWQSASLLLGYPDARLREQLPIVRAAATRLPSRLGTPLLEVVDHLERNDLQVLQEAYVETFDTRRRCNLFLTYFAHGDTRKRGVALLRFKQTYLRSGVALDAQPDTGAELPDHLCVVLEYAATVDQEQGWRLLLDHRAGLELLRLSLLEQESPWAGAVAAISATFPPLRGDERDAVRALAAEGPPAEEVGLTPYGGPAFDATLAEATVDLPMPRVRGG